MERRLLSIPIGAAPVDAGSDPRAGSPLRLTDVTNMRWTKEGALRRRGAFAALSGAPSGVQQVWSDGRDVAFAFNPSTRVVSSYDERTGGWVSLGNNPTARLDSTATLPTTVAVKSTFHSSSGCFSTGATAATTYIVHAWIQEAAAGAATTYDVLAIAVTDLDGRVLGRTVVGGLVPGNLSHPRVVAYGTAACVYVIEDGGLNTHLRRITVTPSASGVTFGTLTNVLSTLYAASPWECLDTGEYAFTRSAGGGATIEYGYLSNTGAVLSSATVARTTAATTDVTQRIAIARYSASYFTLFFWDTGTTWRSYSVDSALASRGAAYAFNVTGPTNTLLAGWGIGAAYLDSSTVQYMLGYTPAGITNPQLMTVSAADNTGAPVALTTVANELLLSRLQSVGLGTSEAAAFGWFQESPTQNPGAYRVLARHWNSTSRRLVGTLPKAPELSLRLFGALQGAFNSGAVDAEATAVALPASLTAVAVHRASVGSFAYTRIPAQIVGRSLVMGGMLPREFNAAQPEAVSESTWPGGSTVRGQIPGFLTAPPAPTLTNAAGALAAGVYSFVLTYAYTDQRGNVHRAVSSASTTTLTAAGGITVQASAYPSWGEGRLIIEAWRTTAGGSTFYRLAQQTGGIGSVGTVTLVTADATTDATLATREVLNLSAPVELWWPPVSAWAARDGRLLGVDQVRNRMVGSAWGSTAHDSTVIAETNDATPVVAIGATASGVYLFGERSTWVVTGDGPDASGAGSFSAPALIDTTYGAVNAESVSTAVDDSLLVVSNRGPVLVGGGRVQPLIEGNLSISADYGSWESTPPRAVVVLADTEEVAIASENGIWLWHRRFNRWARWSYVAYGAAAVGAALWVGTGSTIVTCSQADGGSSDSGGSTVLAGWTTAIMDLTDLAGMGFAKLTRWGLRGTFPTGGTATVSLRAGDDTGTAVDSTTVTWADIGGGFPAAVTYSFMHKTGVRRMPTVRVVFAETAAADARLEFTHLMLEVLTTGRAQRLPSARNI